MAAVLKPRPTKSRPVPLGTAIDALWDLREKKRSAEDVVKKLEGEIKTQEELVMERLDQEGVDKSTGKNASVGISTAVSFNFADFDSFAKYVQKSGHFHLFQRRVSDVACREIFESKGKIPGLEPFTKRKLTLRTLAKES